MLRGDAGVEWRHELQPFVNKDNELAAVLRGTVYRRGLVVFAESMPLLKEVLQEPY